MVANVPQTLSVLISQVLVDWTMWGRGQHLTTIKMIHKLHSCFVHLTHIHGSSLPQTSTSDL